MDELKLTNLDIDKPPMSDTRDNSDNVVVPISMNDEWIEVSTGHYASSSGSIKGGHLLAPDSILTSNRYEPLIDLFNALPIHIKEVAHNIKKLKHELKRFLLEKSFYSVKEYLDYER